MCFFGPVSVLMLATVIAAVAGAVRGSRRAIGAAALLAVPVGAAVLFAAATQEPSDDPDEQVNQMLSRSMVVLWAVSALTTVASAVWIAVHQLRRRQPPTSPQAAEPSAQSRRRPSAGDSAS
jgi:hypothetical protein